MNSATPVLWLFIIFSITALNSGCEKGSEKALESEAAQNLPIGRMRVAIWPEYDDPGILAIYDGKFEKASSYPIKTSFFVPKGSVISDACSLSHKGQHFCQLYKITNRDEYDEVSLLLPYPNFYLSFHTPELNNKAEQKEFAYRIKANHHIEIMEIDIQQPLRSTDFNISADKITAKPEATNHKGFNHFAYTLDNVSKGQENIFNIKYIKGDLKPSVDIKYSRMTGPKVWSSPYETQKNVKTLVYIIFASGIIIIAAISIWFVRFRKKQSKKSA